MYFVIFEIYLRYITLDTGLGTREETATHTRVEAGACARRHATERSERTWGTAQHINFGLGTCLRSAVLSSFFLGAIVRIVIDVER